MNYFSKKIYLRFIEFKYELYHVLDLTSNHKTSVNNTLLL
jgi:hypothetical protein